MTKKDYALLATALKAARDDIVNKEPEVWQGTLHDGVGYAAEHIAEALGRENPAFRHGQFLAACGVAA